MLRMTPAKSAVVGLLLAAGILAYMVHRAGTGQLWNCLVGANVPLLCLAELLLVLEMYVKARRWGTAVRAAIGRPVRGVFSASLIGFATNVIVPARLGELARVHVLGRRNGVSKSLGLTTLGLSQLLDLLALGMYFLCLTLLAGSTLFLSRRVLVMTLAGTVSCLALLLVASRRKAFVPSAARLASRYLPRAVKRRVDHYSEQFQSGLQLLSSSRLIVRVVLQTLAIWTIETAILSLALAAFGVPLHPMMPPLLVVVLNLSAAVPMTPGNVGPHQFLSVLVLGYFHVPEAQALSFSIGYQGLSVLVMLLLGATCFVREGLWSGSAALEAAPRTPHAAQEDLEEAVSARQG